jgi:hypothetical protein
VEALFVLYGNGGVWSSSPTLEVGDSLVRIQVAIRVEVAAQEAKRGLRPATWDNAASFKGRTGEFGSPNASSILAAVSNGDCNR